MSRRIVRRVVVTVTIFLLWELAVSGGLISSIIIPSPTAIVAAARSDGLSFLAAFAVTVTEILLATAVAWTLGILSGLLCARSTGLAIASSAVLSTMFAVPIVILYPLLMAWFGIGMTSKIIFGIASGYFPIALNTLDGMRAIDRTYETMARAAGANQLQIFVRVLVPLAMPSILAGLRIGTGLVVIGVLVAEMLASTNGIGYLITTHRTQLNSAQVYLGFVFAITLAVGVNLGISTIEKRFHIA